MKKTIFLFFAAILCAIGAKAYDQAAVDLYFDNSTSQWANCYVSVGHTGWTAFYDMQRVSGTQYLWKLPANFNGGNKWGGASGWAVSVDKWEGYPKAEDITVKYVWHGDQNVTKLQTTAWGNTKIYKADGTESVSKDGTTKKVYKVTSYTKSNYTVTINTVEGGTLTVKDYDDNAVATGASKIHLTVLKFSAAPASGYVFNGVEINNGSTTTTISAANISSETYTLTSNVTITPVWKATTSTVTVTATATNGTVTGGGVVEEGTSVTLTATPADGYKFVNWTVGGAEVSTANPYTFTAEEDVTVVANFEETPKVTVYFVNNSEWTKIQAYAWEGTKGANPGWPGADITANKLGEQIGGFDVYSYTVEQGSYGKVIFNNGSAQTKDYVWTDGNYYWNNEAEGFVGGTKADAETKFSVPVEYDYVYLINTNDWAKAYIYTWTPEVAGWPGAAMTKEAEQIAGKDVYSYKVVKGTTFGGLNFNCGGDECKTGNLTWQAGKYYAPSKDKWYDDAAAAETGLAAPVVDVYTVVGSDVLLGTAWDLNNADNEMTKQDDGSYVLVKENVDLATTGTYEYKVVKNHSWDWSVPQEGNLTLTGVDVDGTYSVTFTLNKELNALTTSLELVEAKKVIPECYVAGDESLTGQDWNAKSVLMTYDEATEVYTATLTAVPAGTHNMKVVYGGEWLGFDHLATPAPANVKEGEDKKIQFTLAEAGDVTVTYHATNGIGLTGNFAVPVTYDYYIAGTLAGGWSATQQGMTKEGDVYKHTFSALAAGTYEFKITDGQWNSDGDATHEHTTLGAAYEEVSYNEGNIKIVTEEAINLTVIFDATADKITFEGLTLDETPTKYYLIGSFNEWTKADATNELVLDGEVYKKEVTLAKDAEFKVNDGADAWWGKDNLGGKTYAELDFTNDGNLKMKEEKTFTVIFNLTENLITFDGLTVVEDFYTIVGATAITGANWDLANEANKMTKSGEVYTLTKTDLQLEAGDYEYKVAKNGAWSNDDYPNDGSNQKVTITENGVYTIVYTYTVGTSLTAVPEKTGEYTPAQAVYTVAGDAALCGTNWQADDTDNDMSDNGDGTFTWTKTDVKITGTVGFKVVKNHDFGNGAYPNDNWNIVPENYEGNAIYTVTITFTESSTDIDVTLTKTGDVTPAVISYVLMGVNGDWTNGIALTQDPGNADQYVLENQVIIKATDAVKVVTLTDGTASAWCGNVDTWSNATYAADGDGNIVLEDGIYTFYFKKSTDNIYINQTGYARNVTNTYGTICLPYAAASTTGAIFYRVAGKETGKVYLESVDALEAGVPYIFEKTASQIKVVYTGEKETTAGSANGLVGTFTDDTEVAVGNYILKENKLCQAATTCYVNANRAYLVMSEVPAGAPQQMPGRRYIGMSVQGENEATGVEDIFSTDAPVKVIENGQLIIIRDGVKYNVQGQRL